MVKLSVKEAILIDPKNVLAKLILVINQEQNQKIPDVKKLLCYNFPQYYFDKDKLQAICDRYWQIIELWQLPIVKKYLIQTQKDVNIAINNCGNHIQIAKHKERISTCVHYISFRVSGVYWYGISQNTISL